MKPRRPLPSPIVKRSINLDRHKTSVALEDAFWNALKEIAATQKTSVGQLVLKIDRARKNNNFVMRRSCCETESLMTKPALQSLDVVR